MNEPWTVECDVGFTAGRAGRKRLQVEPELGPSREPGRVARVARLMALAIRFDGLLRSGVIKDCAELARLGRVTRARVSQILNLLLLAPDLQEQLLFWPRTLKGRDPLHLAQLQPIALVLDWKRQRKLWATLVSPAASRSQPPGPAAMLE